jgi:nucleotide-binding universal stress UspA family protein
MTFYGSLKSMNVEQKMLFGIHDLESARHALIAAGSLLKERKNIGVTLFHGSPDADLSTVAKLLRLTPEVVEEYRKVCSMQEGEVLEYAKDLLAESGIDPARLATICEGKCHDAAAAMLKLANVEGLDPIILARRREPLLERMLMGPVTYRVVQMAEWRTIWLIDPPVTSQDVLVALVGAPISRRVMEHAVQHFSHLSDSKFTLFHVIPPMPPMYWDDTRIFDEQERKVRDSEKSVWMQDYADRVKEFAEEGKKRLTSEGVPEENVAFKVQPAKKGMAGEILSELEKGNYGILVIGRKGSKEVSPFRLGSIATKLLHNAQRCVICLVN